MPVLAFVRLALEPLEAAELVQGVRPVALQALEAAELVQGVRPGAAARLAEGWPVTLAQSKHQKSGCRHHCGNSRQVADRPRQGAPNPLGPVHPLGIPSRFVIAFVVDSWRPRTSKISLSPPRNTIFQEIMFSEKSANKLQSL